MLQDVSLDRASPEPLYLQLKRQLAHQINNGLLSPGERIPATRDLAEQLGIARISVINAYEELRLEGYIVSHVGRGTFVTGRDIAPGDNGAAALAGARRAQGTSLRELHRLAERPGVFNFSQGAPAEGFLPVDLIREAINTVLERDGAQAVTYEVPEGYPPLRRAVARMASRLGIEVDPEDVLITGGCQQALDLAVQSLLNPGDVLLTGNPTYLGMLDIARARGVIPVGVPVDAEGMHVAALEDLIVEHRPRLIYVAPTYHNPTGAVMPLYRRRQLLDLAAQYRVPVLEDGVYEDLSYIGTPPPPLKALDENDLVLYASSFSKVLMPGMRIGYLLVGGPLHERLARVKQAADICTPGLNQRAIHAVVEGGHFTEHLIHVRAACQVRRDAMLEAAAHYLPEGARWDEPAGGLYLWVELPPGPTAVELYLQALRYGAAFAIGSLFYTDGGGAYHLRLNMVAHPPDVIERGMQQLGAAWHALAAEYQPPVGEVGRPLL